MAAVNGFSNAVVNLNGGTFTLANLTVTSGNNNQLIFNGGTYVASAPQTLGNGVGNVALNVRNGGAIINTNGNNVTLSNPLLNFAGTSTGGLTKQNAGTLSLSGTNTYIGNTIVQGGTLLLSSTASISNSALIQVQSGAVFDASAVTGGFQLGSGQKLENKGTFLGNLTALSGSTFAPGNSPGISTQTGDLTLNTGSTFEFELVANSTATPGTNYDQTQFTLASTTNLTIQTGVNANLVFNFAGSTVNWTDTFWDSNQSWLVFTGADTSTFAGGSGIFNGTTTIGLDSLAQNFSLTGGTFSFSNTGSEVYLNYTAAIPEPSTYAMLAGGLCLLAALRRRARKASSTTR